MLPIIMYDVSHVWHLFVIRTEKRDELQKYLADNGIATQIHYPVPPHLAEAYKLLGHKCGSFPITEEQVNNILSLPLYNGMPKEEISYTIKKINSNWCN